MSDDRSGTLLSGVSFACSVATAFEAILAILRVHDTVTVRCQSADIVAVRCVEVLCALRDVFTYTVVLAGVPPSG